MLPVLAHLGHWYESALFAVPLAVIGGVLWRSARRERLASEHGEQEDWDRDDWTDPRLHDDE
ncbi:MAG: hypothetical protein QM679_07185 [Patulibacter sp.]